MIEFTLNLEVTPAKGSGHWIHRYNQNKKNKLIIHKYWLTLKEKPKPPCQVTLDRIYCRSKNQRPYDDFDNLRTSLKGIVDIIADLLVPGLAPGRADDAVHGIKWDCLQTAGENSRVRIVIEEKR